MADLIMEERGVRFSPLHMGETFLGYRLRLGRAIPLGFSPLHMGETFLGAR